MTENEQKVKLINLQQIATIGFIFTLIISYLLSYDKKLQLQNEKRIFTDKEAQDIALFQTILVFIISATFLYVTYEQYKIAKKYHEKDEKDLLLQTDTAILSIISAMVGLYVVIKNFNNRSLTISEVETI